MIENAQTPMRAAAANSKVNLCNLSIIGSKSLLFQLGLWRINAEITSAHLSIPEGLKERNLSYS